MKKGDWTHLCYGQERKTMDRTWTYCPTCGDMPQGNQDGRLLAAKGLLEVRDFSGGRA